MDNIIFRGSEWRKWDFHVHTPLSFTHQFEGNFADEGSREFQEGFDNYVRELLNKAIENNIAAVGITDYFRIDGYKKIKKEYLDNEDKLSDLLGGDITKITKMKRIFIFPNIEMRLNCFVGKNSEKIDFHVIFSNEIPIEVIEENFINKLTFVYDAPNGSSTDKRSLSPVNVRAFGAKLKREHGFSGDDLTVGYEHLSLSIDEIISTLQGITDFKDKYLTVIDDDKLGNIPWGGRDHSIRKQIVKSSKLQFSNNPSNIEWGLGLRGYDSPKGFIEEFGHLLPSITGSDAHSYGEMFLPKNELYCWVKANANFEGLRQVVFEPTERVKIQTTQPEEKSGDKVIDRIEIKDSPKFDIDPIYFSENLTCIIGGKSTGKSILLRELAKTIDAHEVQIREDEIFSKQKREFNIDNVRVFWKDGSEDHQKRKIVYIPQSYLNRLTDEEQETTQVDNLIEKVLFQNVTIQNAYHLLVSKMQKEKELAGKIILEYTSIYDQIANYEERLKENGDSKTINVLIQTLQTNIDDIAKKLEISEADIQKHDGAKSRIASLDLEINNIVSDIETIRKEDIISALREKIEDTLKHFKSPIIQESFSKEAEVLISLAKGHWDKSKLGIISQLNEMMTSAEKERLEHQKVVEELQPIIEKTEEIKMLVKKKSSEEERKKKSRSNRSRPCAKN